MANKTSSNNSPYQIVLIFLLLVLGIGLIGYVYYIKEKEHILSDKKDELSAIAELKVGQIVNWRKERIVEATAVSNDHLIVSAVGQFLHNPGSPRLRQDILGWLKTRQETYGYRSVLLVDIKGDICLSTNKRQEPLSPGAKKMVRGALLSKKVFLSDIHKGQAVKYIHIDIIVPLIPDKRHSVVPVGAFVMHLTPEEFFFPLIQLWPTPSKTGETLLVEREGDSVLYLNELRHQKNTALSLKVPINKKNYPAGLAVPGQKGIVEGYDYRDVKVLTALRAVPDTPWFIIAKVDADEVYELVRERAWHVMAFVTAMIIAAGIGVGFWWRQRRLEFYRRQYETENELKSSEERYRYLVENARDVIFAVSADGTIVSLNPVFEKITGWSPAEWIGKHFSQIIHHADLPVAAGALQSVLRGEKPPMFELRTLKKSGGYLIGEFLVTPKIWNEEVIGMLGIVRDITERKQTEDALIESEERYRRLVELSPDVVFIQSEGRIAFINPAGIKLFGAASAEELIGKPVLELMHPDYRGIVNERIRILKEEKAEVPLLEEKYLRLDGSSVDVEVAATPFIYRGKPGAQVIARDITERKQVEETLRSLTLRYEAILASVPDIIMQVDNNKVYTWANRAGMEFFGNDVIGKEASFYFEGEQATYSSVKPLFNGSEEVIYVESWQRRKDGERRLLAWWCRVLKDTNGNVTGALSAARDVTERNEAEKELRKSEKFIKNILATVDEGFIVIDNEFKIISANKSYLQAVNKPLEEVTGRHCYELSHHIYKPCHESGEDCPVNITFKTGEPHTALHTHYDSEGNSIFVETKSYPIKDDSGKVVSAIEVINNITEKKKLEDQLHHAQKMEAIGTFAGGIAHDFNNILTAIIGYANLLQMKMKKDEPLRAHIEPILASAERAANLTQSLLAFSRKQTINTKAIDLNEIVGNVEKLLRRLIGEDIELKTSFADNPLTVVADFGQMEQVLVNLATNARDAMPDGGALIIKTGMVKLDEEYIRSHGYGKTGKYAVISVTDTGFGMDEKIREKIFDPFFTTKDLGKGTGLGLSIVYGIIKQHNGYINVYSEPGKGTTFRIYLSLTKSETEKTKISEEAPSIGGTETILLAEDETDVREITKTILEEFGYKVIEAVDGEDAVSKFTGSDGRIELLLFDVIMPKKNGKEAYEEIKKIRPDIKVIFMSGYPADVIDKKGLFDGRINFVSKPVSPTELLRNIREVLDKQAIS